MSGDHTATQHHNLDLLTADLALKQIGSSSLFWGHGLAVLSPAVQKNSQGYFWFDIREANIEKMMALSPESCFLLIRIVPSSFILCRFSEIQKLFTVSKTEKTGKKAWEFVIENAFSKIKNKRSPKDFIEVSPSTRAEIVGWLRR